MEYCLFANDRPERFADDPEAASDGFGTGFVVYVLRQAGLPTDHPALRRGVGWLTTHQRASGRWFARSLNDNKAHDITHAGAGFAVLALSPGGVAPGATDDGPARPPEATHTQAH